MKAQMFVPFQSAIILRYWKNFVSYKFYYADLVFLIWKA